MPAKEEEEEEKNIPVAVKEMEIEYLEGNSDGFSFKAIVDLVVEERAALPLGAVGAK